MVRQTKKKNSKAQMFLVSLLMIVIVIFAYKSTFILRDQYLFEKNDGDKITPVPSLTITSNSAVPISSDSLHSPHAILLCLNEHTILMQKKSEEAIYPASLTKMMTAIVAIENLPNGGADKNLDLI